MQIHDYITLVPMNKKIYTKNSVSIMVTIEGILSKRSNK